MATTFRLFNVFVSSPSDVHRERDLVEEIIKKVDRTCKVLFFFLGPLLSSARQISTDSLLTGVWKGTSICQIRNSPCHDENVVYYISKVQGVDTFKVMATKIVNGKEEEMGTLGFKFNKKKSQLISTDYGLWTFTLKGNTMDGTLFVRGELYRVIKLSKQQ